MVTGSIAGMVPARPRSSQVARATMSRSQRPMHIPIPRSPDSREASLPSSRANLPPVHAQSQAVADTANPSPSPPQPHPHPRSTPSRVRRLHDRKAGRTAPPASHDLSCSARFREKRTRSTVGRAYPAHPTQAPIMCRRLHPRVRRLRSNRTTEDRSSHSRTSSQADPNSVVARPSAPLAAASLQMAVVQPRETARRVCSRSTAYVRRSRSARARRPSCASRTSGIAPRRSCTR
jgi:hypothetical protein